MLNVVTVQRGDSLRKLAQKNIGQDLRWRELVSVNPGIRDPNHIVAGSQIYLPAAVSAVRATKRYSVRRGDSLWTIAQSQFGHAAFCTCIAHASPDIRDAKLVCEGQVLLVPSSCTR